MGRFLVTTLAGKKLFLRFPVFQIKHSEAFLPSAQTTGNFLPLKTDQNQQFPTKPK